MARGWLVICALAAGTAHAEPRHTVFGELLGKGGLWGHGQRELFQALFGIGKAKGSIELWGREMTARGYTVFVLVYRLPGEGWNGRADVPLQDAQRAVRVIRARSGEYGCDPARLYTVGFSAGGHLAASLATDFAQAVYPGADKADELSARPRGVGLVYPVISQEPGIGHAESSLRLLGENPSADLIARRSPARHVTAQTPPSFMVHAMDDPAVPVENSFIMLRALRAAQRPAEAHFYEEGGHGFGLGPPDRPVRSWIELFANWIERQEAIAATAA